MAELLDTLVKRLASHGIDILTGPNADELRSYVAWLEEAYRWRYPDAWPQVMAMDNKVGRLDSTYIWLRDNIVHNLPLEQQERGRLFIGTWRDAYNSGVIDAIHKNDARDPFELLKLHNASLDDAYSIA